MKAVIELFTILTEMSNKERAKEKDIKENEEMKMKW
jgi:hypothetical protein